MDWYKKQNFSLHRSLNYVFCTGFSNSICTEVFAVATGLSSFNSVSHLTSPLDQYITRKSTPKQKESYLITDCRGRLLTEDSFFPLWTWENAECLFYIRDVNSYFWNHTLSNIYMCKHTYTSVFSFSRNLNYVKEKLKQLNSNCTEDLSPPLFNHLNMVSC